MDRRDIKSTFKTKAQISLLIMECLDELEGLVNRGGGASDIALRLAALDKWLQTAEEMGFRQELPGFIEQEKADIETRLYEIQQTA